jgi:hypothetical protein
MKAKRSIIINSGSWVPACSYPLIAFTVIMLLAISCITPFEPDLKVESNLLVVDGSLIKGQQKQEIRISRSTSFTKPVLQFEEECIVRVVDDSGNEFIFNEESPGKYVASIDDALLSYTSHYKLMISTPSGQDYESDYQALPETPPVDSIYSIRETQYVPDADESLSGMQFYVDLDAPDDASRYYRWQVVETWELHALHKIYGVYDGKTIVIDQFNPSDSLYYCWDSKMANGIYTYSTISQAQNKLSKVPLHFKPYNSPELTIKYSATVRQFALDEDAYYYWHQKETELKESGQIYETQPGQVRSNIHNTMNPDEKVLGYFWVSSVTEKHAFEKNPFYNDKAIDPASCVTYGACAEVVDSNLIKSMYRITQFTWNFPLPPVYLYYERGSTGLNCFYFTKDACIDCRRIGGTNHKPYFWE